MLSTTRFSTLCKVQVHFYATEIDKLYSREAFVMCSSQESERES